MPQFIQSSYAPDNALSKAIANLGESLVPSPANQLAMSNVRKIQLQQEIASDMAAKTRLALSGDVDAQRELAARGVEYDPAKGLDWIRYGKISGMNNQAPGYRADASQTMLATGAPDSSTPIHQDVAGQQAIAQGQQRIGGEMQLQGLRGTQAASQADQAARIAQEAEDRKLVWVMGPDGKTPMQTTQGALRQSATGGAAAPGAGGPPAAVPGAPLAGGAPNPLAGVRPMPETPVITKQMEIDQANAVAAAAREAELNTPIPVIDRTTGERVNVPKKEWAANPQRYTVLDEATVRTQEVRNRGEVEKVQAEADAKMRLPEPHLDNRTGQIVEVSRLDASLAPGRYQPLLPGEGATNALVQRSMIPTTAAPQAPTSADPLTAMEQSMVAPAPAPLPSEGGTNVGNVTLPPGTPGMVADKLRGPVEVERLKDASKRTDTTVDAAFKVAETAKSMKQNLSSIKQLIDKGQLETGPMHAALLPAYKIAAEAGWMDPARVGAMEALEGRSNLAVVDALGGSLGAQISNTDRAFLEATKPRLANTNEGNRLTIEILDRVASRQIASADEIARVRAQNPGLSPEQLRMHMQQWTQKQGDVFAGLQMATPAQPTSETRRTAPASGWKIERAQ